MLGRTPRTTQTVFGLRQEDGFETAFFSGVTIEIVAGSGLQMLMPGEAVLTGLSPAEIVMPGEMEMRSEEHTSELQSLMRISYAVLCWKKKTKRKQYRQASIK